MFVTLMYHLIDRRVVHPMSIAERSFQEQLSALADLGVTFLALRDVDTILDIVRAPARGVLITFDDGYRNSIDTALPLLDEYDAPAVLAICGSYLRAATRPRPTIHPSQNFAELEGITTWLTSGRDLASHSYDHPRLTDMSEDHVRWQVTHNKAILESAFQRTIDTFVYPFGAVDSRVERIVGTCHRNAFSDSGGRVPAPDDRLAIRRMRVKPEWSTKEFASYVSHAFAAIGERA